MDFLRRFLWDCKTLVFPLIAVTIASVALLATGHDRLAFFVSYGASFLVVAANFFYIALIDSKKRWPKLTTDQRIKKILFFQR